MARLKNWTFTRFADDLTFSSDSPFSPAHIQELRCLATTFGLVFNETKFVVRSPALLKTVTGLVLRNGQVELPASFVDDTLAEIGKLKHLLEIHYRSGRPTALWLEQYQQQIEGQMAFAEFVLADSDHQFRMLQSAYNGALQPAEICEPVSWINAAYL